MPLNAKSCLLDAALIAINGGRIPYPAEYDAYLATIGHDGSKNGFHSMEVHDAMVVINKIGFFRHDTLPATRIPGGQIVPLYTREQAPRIMEIRLDRAKLGGVLSCRKPNGVHHAYAFLRGNYAIDPSDESLVPIEQLDVAHFYEMVRIG